MSVLRFALMYFVVFTASYGFGNDVSDCAPEQKFYTWKTSRENNFYVSENGNCQIFVPGDLDDHKFNKIFERVCWTSMRDINRDNPFVELAVKIFQSGFEHGLTQLQFLPVEHVDACLIMVKRAVLQDELGGRFENLAQAVGCENSYDKELNLAYAVLDYLLSPEAK